MVRYSYSLLQGFLGVFFRLRLHPNSQQEQGHMRERCADRVSTGSTSLYAGQGLRADKKIYHNMHLQTLEEDAHVSQHIERIWQWFSCITLTHSFTHVLTHSLTRSPTHSLSHPIHSSLFPPGLVTMLLSKVSSIASHTSRGSSNSSVTTTVDSVMSPTRCSG